jgi:hypothetical protein
MSFGALNFSFTNPDGTYNLTTILIVGLGVFLIARK